MTLDDRITQLVRRYTFLISRGWTEKEKVARKRTADQTHVQDEKVTKVTFKEGFNHFRHFLTYKVPDSIFVKTANKEY